MYWCNIIFFKKCYYSFFNYILSTCRKSFFFILKCIRCYSIASRVSSIRLYYLWISKLLLNFIFLIADSDGIIIFCDFFSRKNWRFLACIYCIKIRLYLSRMTFDKEHNSKSYLLFIYILVSIKSEIICLGIKFLIWNNQPN